MFKKEESDDSGRALISVNGENMIEKWDGSSGEPVKSVKTRYLTFTGPNEFFIDRPILKRVGFILDGIFIQSSIDVTDTFSVEVGKHNLTFIQVYHENGGNIEISLDLDIQVDTSVRVIKGEDGYHLVVDPESSRIE